MTHKVSWDVANSSSSAVWNRCSEWCIFWCINVCWTLTWSFMNWASIKDTVHARWSEHIGVVRISGVIVKYVLVWLLKESLTVVEFLQSLTSYWGNNYDSLESDFPRTETHRGCWYSRDYNRMLVNYAHTGSEGKNIIKPFLNNIFIRC